MVIWDVLPRFAQNYRHERRIIPIYRVLVCLKPPVRSVRAFPGNSPSVAYGNEMAFRPTLSASGSELFIPIWSIFQDNGELRPKDNPFIPRAWT